MQVLKDYQGTISLKELSEMTAIKVEDVVSTLQHLNLIQYQKGQHVICAAPKLIERLITGLGHTLLNAACMSVRACMYICWQACVYTDVHPKRAAQQCLAYQVHACLCMKLAKWAELKCFESLHGCQHVKSMHASYISITQLIHNTASAAEHAGVTNPCTVKSHQIHHPQLHQ